MPQSMETVHALILGRKNIGERDRLLFLFTREYGLVLAKAKSARALASKLAQHLEPMQPVVLQLAYKHSQTTSSDGSVPVALVTGAQRVSGAVAVPATWSLTVLMAGKIIRTLLEQQHAHVALWDEIQDLLRRVSALPPAAQSVWMVVLLLRLAQHLGIAPEVQRCAVDGAPLDPEHLRFSYAHGGVLCRRHTNGVPLAANQVKILRLALHEYPTLLQMEIDPAVVRPLPDIVTAFIQYATHRRW